MNLENQKTKAEGGSSSESKQKESGKKPGVDCFNCSESGHYSSECKKAKTCHIYKGKDHEAVNCLEWEKPKEAAGYYRSANSGLGFFRIDVEDRPRRHKN